MKRLPAPRVAWLVATAILVLPACGDEVATTAAGTDPLAATTWTLVSYVDESGDEQPALPGNPATLAFGEDGFVTGNTGCNSFRGSYEADGTSLTFSSAATTMMACLPPEAAAQEQAVLAGLEASAAFEVSAEELVVLDGDGEPLLVYVPASTDLAGTRWGVVGINNGEGAVVASAGSEAAEVELREGGELAGTTGCRDLTGTYEQGDDGALTLRPDTTGTASCAPEQAEVEADLLAALSATTTYQLSSNLLTLRDGSGATQVTLQRR